MGKFGEAAGTILAINLGFIGMFVFGPGLAVPVPTSVSPPSVCIAQLPVYQLVGTMQSCLVAILVASILLCGYVKTEVSSLEGEDLAEMMDETQRRLLRAGLLLGIALSAATTATGLATYVQVFQVKVSVLACVPMGAQVSLFSCYAVAAVVCAFVYYKLAKAAITAN
ncbi:unnamed protein product [Urochloa decumbens]|uniref:MotA/TolQ/ExbB proton channel domain-containing protein n=1 Tax=Urochloa decumbens TaxID=240449 RepID=A0ABC9DCA0_9POAL